MQFKLTARHDHPSEAVLAYAEAKLSKLDRRLHELTLVDLTLSRERNPSIADDHVVDAVVHMKGTDVKVREAAPTYEAAIDKLVDTLKRQIERYRDKRTVEARRRSQAGVAVPVPEEPIELPRDETAA